MNRSLFHKLFILLLALPALACGLLGEDPTPTPPPAPTNTAAPAATAVPPTSTPVPATDTPAPTPTSDITADFVTLESPELGLSIQHPADWVSDDFFFLIIASDQEIIDANSPPTEGAAMVLLADTTESLGASDPAELLNVGLEQFNLGETFTIVEGPDPTAIQGQDAVIARIEGSSEDNNLEYVGLAVAIVEGEYGAFGLGLTPQDNSEEYLPTLEAMVNTIMLSEPTGDNPEIPTEAPTVEDAVMVSVGDMFASNFDADSTRDFFFDGQAGSPINFHIEPIDDGLDLVMEIFDADLNSLVRVDETFTDDAEEVVFSPPADGRYYLRVKDFSGQAGNFNISVTEGIVEAPTDLTPLSAGEVVLGRLDGGPVNYVISGRAGLPSAVFVVPEEDLDPTLTILGTDGSVLADKNDYGFSGEFEGIAYTPQTDGDLVVVVDAFGSASGGYAIYLMDPDTAFTAEGTVPANGEQEISVCVPGGEAPIVFVNPVESFDPVVNLLDADGNELTDRVDNGASGEAEFAILTDDESLDNDYTVVISVSGFGGQGGNFTLMVASTSSDGVTSGGC